VPWFAQARPNGAGRAVATTSFGQSGGKTWLRRPKGFANHGTRQSEIVTRVDTDMKRPGGAVARRLPDPPGPTAHVRPPRTCGMTQGRGQDLHTATLPASVNAGILGLCHACGILASARPPPTPPPGSRCCRSGCQDCSCCGSPSGSSSDCCSRNRHAARGGYYSPDPLGHNTAEAAVIAATRASGFAKASLDKSPLDPGSVKGKRTKCKGQSEISPRPPPTPPHGNRGSRSG
jgi:hypothetical protein